MKLPSHLEGCDSIFKDEYTDIRLFSRLTPTGKRDFHVKVEADIAVCLPIDKDDMAIFVEEYRAGPNIILTEVPGGSVEAGEDPKIAARREVKEETGYDGELVHLLTTFVSAYSTAKKYIFVMLHAEKISDPTHSTGEEINVVMVPVAKLAKNGLSSDADAILAAILYFKGK